MNPREFIEKMTEVLPQAIKGEYIKVTEMTLFQALTLQIGYIKEIEKYLECLQDTDLVLEIRSHLESIEILTKYLGIGLEVWQNDHNI